MFQGETIPPIEANGMMNKQWREWMEVQQVERDVEQLSGSRTQNGGGIPVDEARVWPI